MPRSLVEYHAWEEEPVEAGECTLRQIFRREVQRASRSIVPTAGVRSLTCNSAGIKKACAQVHSLQLCACQSVKANVQDASRLQEPSSCVESMANPSSFLLQGYFMVRNATKTELDRGLSREVRVLFLFGVLLQM